jgi:hypothetical protein
MAATLPVDIASIPSDRASLILDLAERVRQLNIGLRMKRAEYDTVQQQVSKLNQEAAEIEHQLKATQAALLNCVGEQ